MDGSVKALKHPMKTRGLRETQVRLETNATNLLVNYFRRVLAETGQRAHYQCATICSPRIKIVLQLHNTQKALMYSAHMQPSHTRASNCACDTPNSFWPRE